MRLHNSHSPTHTTNKGDTVNHLTFNLTFPRLSRFCNAVWNTFYWGCFFQQTKEDKQSLFYMIAVCHLCALCGFHPDRWTHRASSPSKHPPDCTHLCFHPYWHQVGICWFFNICKSLQNVALARFSHQGQVELTRMTAQLLNQIWGFNTSWKLDRMWASIKAVVRV